CTDLTVALGSNQCSLETIRTPRVDLHDVVKCTTSLPGKCVVHTDLRQLVGSKSFRLVSFISLAVEVKYAEQGDFFSASVCWGQWSKYDLIGSQPKGPARKLL
ncbi:hypothetical protein XENOCAPTIV_012293, partial [Xenoophorus captivus]